YTVLPVSSNVATEEIASQIHSNATEITIVEIIRTKPTVASSPIKSCSADVPKKYL
ncbi:unnamed protein product, partial [Allacma fusca]